MKLIVLKNLVPINEVQVDIPDLEDSYEIFVGRADDCHVLIDDPLISRHHFVIKNENGVWYCEKLTQLGVVLVNGSVASKNRLNGGDEIKCGIYSIMVTDLPGMSSPTPEPALPVFVEPVAPAHVEPLIPSEPLPTMDELIADGPVIEEEALETLEEVPVDEDSLNLDQDSEELPQDDSFSTETVQDEGEGFDPGAGEEGAFGDEGSTSLEAIPNEGEDSQEKTSFFRAFVNYQLLLFGEHAPYDRYQIDSDEIFIGRDTKKCQIILDDPEVSSVHAVLRKTLTEVKLEDLNSSNGTILNGERINKAQVNTGDEFIIGGTTFTLEVRSDLLEAESGRLMPVEKGQVIETEELVEEEVTMAEGEGTDFNSDAPPEKSLIKRIMKNPEQRKKALIGAAVLMLAWAFLGEESKDIPEANPNQEKKVAEATKVDPNAKKKIQLSPENENKRNMHYELGVSFFEQNKYFEALKEFEVVVTLDPEFKKVQSYLEQTKVGLKRLEQLAAEKQAELERLEKKKKIEELLVKARESVKERKVQVSESFFSQIAELDPENIEVGQLKLDLESWVKEEEKKALEAAAKIAARKRMVDSLAPGKTYYLKKEWYRSILRLEEFLRIKGMDEDLVKEGSEMLSDAKNQLSSELGPLLGKARSLKEGQDLKNAYEAFLEILKLEPTNAEALNEVDDIKSQLEMRSKRIYREAIISESLSLFIDAKEKFLEVQQISPTDSEYYRKASDKLKNYME